MFQRLGLRYVIFADRGILMGLLTKKDVWFVLNEDEIGGGGRPEDEGARVGMGAGVLREDGDGEERGLLGGGTDDGDAGDIRDQALDDRHR